MEFEELQKLFEFLETKMFFREPISRKDQIKYDDAFEKLKKKANILDIRNKFFVENESFLSVIYDSIENGAKYLKVHLIEDDLGVNIGLSFCKEEVQTEAEQNNTIDNDLDFFWITDNNKLVKSNRKEFNEYKTRFCKGTLLKINTHTNKVNTEYVKYEIDDVIRYLIRNLISNTFVIKGIMFNQFVFKDYEIKMNDRIGISVHALLEEVPDTIKKNTASSIVSIGYDFGTVYP